MCETFYIEGKKHKKDGPARILYKKDSSIEFAEFWLRGRKHGFWDFYDQSSPENQKNLLRVRLPYHV
jgi:hypothetical protein